MKSVAIVGFYGPTLPHLKNSKAEEVWGANHSYMVMGPKGDMPRCTRLFEIHKEEWFRRKELPVYEEYWNWLRQEHPFDIYLQTAIPEIPSGVVYPFDEVCADIFPHLLRRHADGSETPDKFLTSSASFMLALAIHEGYERIEIYGIGMETSTEYGYQLPGFTYLTGLANGRGIDVVNMEESPVCKAEVYAYSAIPYISIERLHELKTVYDAQLKQRLITEREVIGAYNAHPTPEKQPAAQASSDSRAVASGACAALNALIEMDSKYMSRQALEVKKRTYDHDFELHKAETNSLGGQYANLLKAQKIDQARAVWKRYLDERALMHANSGAIQFMDNLVAECDLLKPSHETVVTVKDE